MQLVPKAIEEDITQIATRDRHRPRGSDGSCPIQPLDANRPLSSSSHWAEKVEQAKQALTEVFCFHNP